MVKARYRSVALLTSGGDCPGLNAVIRAVVKTAINKYKLKIWGIQDGFLGLIEKRMDLMGFNDVSNILTVGGTILGTSNVANPFKYPIEVQNKMRFEDVSDSCLKILGELGVDALICIGGDGTMSSAASLAKKGLTVMGVPKTIDNDVYGTDITFGFDTAVLTATEAIDKVHTTASSHHRVMIVEVMGRYAGWIALYSGVASGADVILIPELPYEFEKVCKDVVGRSQRGKRFSIIVAAEGAIRKGGQMVISQKIRKSPDPIRLGGIANKLANDISEETNLDCRAVTLGHVQRGGTPTPYDRTLATRFGHKVVELLINGVKNHLVVMKNGKLTSIPLMLVAGKTKKVPRNHSLVRAAVAIGTSFGF